MLFSSRKFASRPNPNHRAQQQRLSKRRETRRLAARGLETLERRLVLSGLSLTVTNLSPAGEGSLTDAVEEANSVPGHDTIHFADGLAGTITLDEQIQITDDLTIDGPGADEIIVSGGGSSRVFLALPASMQDDFQRFPVIGELDGSPDVTIKSLSINDGFATDAAGFPAAGTTPLNPGFAFGGGVYSLGASVVLDDVSMTGNVAQSAITAGGAVANEFGGSLKISGSTFSGNSSLGGLIATGGAVTSDLGPQQDESGLVADEEGTFLFTTDSPEVKIRDSEFIGNIAAGASLAVAGIPFGGLAGGGAILNVTGAMTIVASEFAGNQAIAGSVDVLGGTVPTVSGGVASGGAIVSGNASPFGFKPSELIVRDSVFAENTATGGDGGDTDLPGGASVGGAVAVNNLGSASLTRNQFLGNVAAGGAGGIGAVGGLADGGALSTSSGSEVSLRRNVFRGNTADGGLGDGTAPGAYGRGGAISNSELVFEGVLPGPGTIESVRDRLTGNTAVGGMGGAIYNEGGMSMQRATIADNQAVGAADAFGTFVTGYLFQGTAAGGGIMNNGGDLEMSRSRIVGNEAIGADQSQGRNFSNVELGILPGLGGGGGLYNTGTATLDRITVARNVTAGSDGSAGSFAGVAIGGGLYNDATMTLTDSKVIGNRSLGGDDNTADFNPGTSFGGGIASGTFTALVTGRTAQLTVDSTKVKGNHSIGGDGNANDDLGFPIPIAQQASAGFGGGIHVYEGTAEISRTQVKNNRAIGGEAAPAAAGGIFIFGYVNNVDGNVTTGTISRTIVSGNRAIGGDGNSAYGGGITVGSFGSLFSTGAAADLSRTIIRSNRAIGGSGGDGLGGGLYSASGSTVDAKRLIVSQNLARGGSGGDGLGGGIFNDEDSELDLTLSLIFANRAQGVAGGEGIGGGIYNAGDLDETLTLIFANWASDSDNNCFGC